MNIYINILKTLLNKEAYLRYASIVLKYYSNKPELKKVLLSLEEYFGKDSSKDTLSVDDAEAVVNTMYPSMRDKERDILAPIFDRLRSCDADPALIDTYLAELERSEVATELAVRAVELAEGKGSYQDLIKLVERLERPPNEVSEDLFVTDDLEELLNEQLNRPGLNWRLGCLRKSLGPLRKGDFGFIFKRPETGGTTLLASELSYMLTDGAGTERPTILWFNNEEQGGKVKLRFYQAYFGVTLQELATNRAEYRQRYLDEVQGRFKLLDSSSLHRATVEKVVSSQSPSLVVIDQIDKVKGFEDAERGDLLYGRIYQWARELAKGHCAVIGVCQAYGGAEGKMWLDMGDVAEAKTAKQAEADFILGIGKSHKSGHEYTRYFNICKNKLIGGPETDPAMRHGQLYTIIKPEIARYEDVV